MSRPNILLVILDSVRARNTSLLGHHRKTTPRLDALAEEATLYTQARSPSITSFESHASIFSGLYPSEHGLKTYDESLPQGSTIWEDLRDEHGYDTAVFSANGFATGEEYGIARGFDTIVRGGDLLDDLPFPDGIDPRSHYATGIDALARIKNHDRPFRSFANHLLVGLAERFPHLSSNIALGEDIYEQQFYGWQRSRTDPWAACINFQDAHTSYLADAPGHDEWGGPDLRDIYRDVGHSFVEFTNGEHPWWVSEAYEHLYDGCIKKADERIGRIVASLREAGELDETLLVVTSDHGEAFGELSRVRQDVRLAGHGPGIHEVKVHVPLLVKYPEQSEGRRIDSPASLVEFPDVVHEVVRGINPDEGFVPDGPVLAESNGYEVRHDIDDAGTRLERLTGHARAVYDERDDGVRKYAAWGEDACTVVVRDAQTSYRVSDAGMAEVEDAFAVLNTEDLASNRGSDLSEATEERLRNFGYLD